MSQNENQNTIDFSDEDKAHKIQSLRDMISNAEKTIQGAKAMLLQFEGKKKVGRKRKLDSDEEGTIIEGTFDGQLMIGTDGKQYPVPANYASKSKLIEGDMLKLTITNDGSFIYKQIGPIDRRNLIGTVNQDENGNFYIASEGRPYKVLLASITYFRAMPGDEVVIVVPREMDSTWAAIENVIQKGVYTNQPAPKTKRFSVDDEIEELKKEFNSKKSTEIETNEDNEKNSIIDEWASDIEEIERESKKEHQI